MRKTIGTGLLGSARFPASAHVPGASTHTTITSDPGAYQGRNTFRAIPELRKIGVADSAIQDLIDWGQKTWPRGPWGTLR